MDLFFNNPDKTRLSPEEVRLREMKVTPQPNGRRLKIHLELTPFENRPNIEVSITARSGKEVAHTSILETMLPKLEFTMHVREPDPDSEYTIESIVYYQPMPKPSDGPLDVLLPEPMIVDRYKATFILRKLET